MINDQFLSIQRGLLLCVTKRYGTVPTDSLIVLSVVFPLDLPAGLERDYIALTRRGKSVEGTNLSPDSVKVLNATPER